MDRVDLPASGGDLHNPYGFFEHLRTLGPIHSINLPGTERAWVVCGYKHVEQIFRDRRFTREPPGYTGSINLVRLRQVLSAGLARSNSFCPDALLHAAASCLAGSISVSGKADLVRDFAQPLTAVAFEALLNVPSKDSLWLREHLLLFSPLANERGYAANSDSVKGKLSNYLITLAERNSSDQRTFFGSLIATASREISVSEVAEATLSMLAAGYEPTVHLLSSALLVLLTKRPSVRILRDHPELITSAVHELVRFDSPVFPGAVRHVSRSLEYAGQSLLRGDVVLLPIAAAGRDPTHYERAEAFDVHARSRHTLAFGYGKHRCLGASFAKRVLAAGVAGFVAHAPETELDLMKGPHWSCQRLRALLALPTVEPASR